MSIVLSLQVDKSKPARRGKDHYWAVIRELTAAGPDATFVVQDVLGASDGSVQWGTVAGFLRNLTKAGILAEVGGKPKRWRALKRPTRVPRLSKDGRVVPSGQAQMWTAMRALQSFRAEELALAASTEECPVTVNTAKTYALRLAAAGYLKSDALAAKGTPTVYQLRRSMNTGPLPPMILRAKLVYDANREEIMGPVATEETAP